MNQLKYSQGASPFTDTPVSMSIIVLCAVIFLTGFAPPQLALFPMQSPYFMPWQLVSYALLHGNFNHLFFNMFAVWMFGTPLERAWGSRRFGGFFTVSVVGAALAQLLVQTLSGDYAVTIGASGGVFGLLLAYGVMWPENRLFLLFFPVPVKAKWFVLIYGAVELLFGVTGAQSGVAHFAHLGGMIFAAILLYKWGWRPGMTWKR